MNLLSTSTLIAFSLICVIEITTSALSNESIVFSSKREVFVGENAILEWKFHTNLIKIIAEIKFGVITRPATHGERLDAILVKKLPNGTISWNYRDAPKQVAKFVNRTTVLSNKTAAFVISKVTLNDSSEFYCAAKRIGSSQNMITDYIKLKVIDVEILAKKSSQDIISWKGHKVHLRCKVRTLPKTSISFMWRNKATGGSIVNHKKHRDHEADSFLKIRTLHDEDFGPYECVAMTAATAYSHEIRIKRLFEPSAPNNFSHHRKLTNSPNCSVVSRLSWMQPLEDGGAPVTSYNVEYKPFGSQWYKANSRRVDNNYIYICRPPRDRGGDGLRVRVRARNKVGFGEPSPATVVTFWDEPTAPQELRTQLVRSLGEEFIKLTWGYPRDDGGISVSAYQIEYKPLGSTWRNAARSEETLKQETTLWKTSKNVILYEVRIRAINGVGFGEWSNTIQAAFAEVPSRPLDVSDRILPHVQEKYPHIHIHWRRPLDDGGLPIKRYRLEYKRISQKEWKQGKSKVVNDQSYVIDHVIESQEYKVRVAAENEMGTGAWSNVITVKYREKPFVASASSHATTTEMISSWQIMTLGGLFSVFYLPYYDVYEREILCI